MAQETHKLSSQQRAERVLASVGRAAGLLGSFPPDVRAKLAALCSETGDVTAGGGDVLRDYWDSQKATIEPEEVNVPEVKE